MPTLDEIRTTLLREHDELRACIEEARAATAKWQSEGAPFELPKSCLDRLAEGFRAHNATEEAVLHEVLPTLDAWGHARKEVMVDEHVAEHQAVFKTLTEASKATDKTAAAASITALLDKILVHIATEEKAFLGADVLNDDLKVDSFGG